MTSCDAIIVGGGHNGLVAAGYLTRWGLKTVVLERRAVLGGACVTEEPWPGYKVSSLAYLCSLFQRRIVRDLELERFGYQIYPKDPAFFTPLADGRHLFFWQDEAKTLAEIAKFSARDAAAFPAYEAQVARLADLVESTLLEAPPNLPFRRLKDALAMAKLGLSIWKASCADMTAFCKIMTQSVRDFLAERFESDVLQATLATDGIIGACGSAATPGTAYTLLHHCMGSATGKRGLWGFVRGGMGGDQRRLGSGGGGARSRDSHRGSRLPHPSQRRPRPRRGSGGRFGAPEPLRSFQCRPASDVSRPRGARMPGR